MANLITVYFNSKVSFNKKLLNLDNLDVDFDEVEIKPGQYVRFKEYQVLVAWNTIQYIKGISSSEMYALELRR